VKVILLVGLPGSGKSTYAIAQGWPILSSDDTRRLLLDDARDQAANRSVFALLRRLLRMRLELGRPVTCVDATSLTIGERRPYIKTAQMYGAEIEAVFLDTPVDVCKQRNQARDRVVPDDVMDRFAAKLRVPSVDEGFTMVTAIRL
jgi:protein phosphatase